MESSTNRTRFVAALLESWMGILLAGPIFGVSCVIFSLGGGVGGNPVGWVMIAGLAAVFGGVLASISSVFAIAAVAIVNRSLGSVCPPRTGVMVFGGLSGFAAAAGLFFSFDGPAVVSDLWVFEMPAIGVVAAMVFGQIGGLWWPILMGLPSMGLPSTGLPSVTQAASEEEPTTFQFQIRHLLVVTLWFGLLFAIDQLWESNGLIVLVAFYVVSQGILLLAFHLVFHLRARGNDPTVDTWN